MDEIGACLATINKIQTTIDGGIRLTLDLNPTESEIIKKLFDLKISNTSEICVGFSKIEESGCGDFISFGGVDLE